MMKTGLLMLAFLVTPLMGIADDSGIKVSGTGTASAVPTCAHVTAGVVTSHAKAVTSLKSNSETMTKVFEALDTHKIAKEDRKTVGFRIEPVYQYEQNKPAVMTGYATSNNVTVTVRKLDDLGAVLDTLVTNGANNVGSISFEADTDAAYTLALKDAMKNARAKAELLANMEDHELGTVKSIVEEVNYGSRTSSDYSRRELSDAPGAIPIAAGSQKVTVRVSVIYNLGWTISKKVPPPLGPGAGGPAPPKK